MIGHGWIGRIGVMAACLVLAGSCGNADEASTTAPPVRATAEDVLADPDTRGDGDEASATDSLVQAIAEDLLADPNAPFSSQGSADCFAVEIVSSIGEARLNELGFTVTNIPDEFQTNWTSDEVDTIIGQMLAGRFRHMPVVDGANGLCGLVSLGDLAGARIATG